MKRGSAGLAAESVSIRSGSEGRRPARPWAAFSPPPGPTRTATRSTPPSGATRSIMQKSASSGTIVSQIASSVSRMVTARSETSAIWCRTSKRFAASLVLARAIAKRAIASASKTPSTTIAMASNVCSSLETG